MPIDPKQSVVARTPQEKEESGECCQQEEKDNADTSNV